MNIKEQVLNGCIPEELKILDAHAHVGEGEYSNAFIYSLPVEDALRLSKGIGIKKMAASSLKAIGGNLRAGNDRLFELCEKYPEDLLAYVYFSPKNAEECLEYLDQHKNSPFFVGVKIHPREEDVFATDPAYLKLYKYAAENDILILAHTWETEAMNSPALFSEVMAKFPEMKFLVGHMGGTYKGCMDSIELANAYPNVFLDINGWLYSEIWIEELVKYAHVEKFIFSTDQVFNDPLITLGRVLLSDLDDETKQKILCGNFERLLGRQLL